jgi:hypothetical protein
MILPLGTAIVTCRRILDMTRNSSIDEVISTCRYRSSDLEHCAGSAVGDLGLCAGNGLVAGHRLA